MVLNNRTRYSDLVSLIVLSRLILSPLLFYLINKGNILLGLLILLLAISTDFLDGYLVRKLNAKPINSYLDPISDFILIFTCFLAFVINNTYPSMILLLIIFMFAQFLLSSEFKNPIYDPIGKYYGIFLYIMVGITISTNNYIESRLILLVILLMTIVSLISRILFFKNKNNKI